MKWNDLKEFWHYCCLRLEEWLKAPRTRTHYQSILTRIRFLGSIIGRLYFENLYLNQKNRLLKKVNRQAGKYEDTWKSKIRIGGLLVIMMLLTYWIRWILLPDSVAIIGYICYQHQQYLNDPATTAVELTKDKLQTLTLQQEFYQRPKFVLENLVKLYEFLRVGNQGIFFDDFIAAETVQRIDEPGFTGLIIFAITSRYPNIKVIDSKDLMLNYYILPDVKSKDYILNGWIKLDLIGLLRRESLGETLDVMAQNKVYTCYPEVKNKILRIEKDNLNRKRQQYVDNHNLPKKVWSIWDFFDLKVRQLGFSYWDNNSESIVGNNNYIKVRMRLIGENTYNDAKKKVDLVAKQLRCDVMTSPIASDHGSFWMTFILNEIKAPKTTNVTTIKRNADKGYFNLGNSRTGEYLVKLPRADELTSLLIGGISRSGKSTLSTQLISSLLYLKTNDKYDYSDVYIGTVKDEDYLSNGFKDTGMLIESEPLKIYEMLKYVDSKATERKQLFIDHGVKNIKEYNHKYPNDHLGKWLIIFDEYANTLAAAEREQIKVGGKKVKLRDAIEQIMVKIGQEHGSRGVSLIVITQQFSKGEVGRLFDATNIHILGYAQPNVWNSIDNTQEMAKHLQAKGNQRQGLFFINAPDLPVKNPQVTFSNGFTEIRTANIDTEEVRQNFDRQFKTSDEYYTTNGLGTYETKIEPKQITIEELIDSEKA